MFNAEFFQDPYQAYDDLRSRGPVHQIQTAEQGLPIWLIVGYREAREALNDSRLSKDTRRFGHLFSDNRNIASAVRMSILATDPPDHTRLRRLVMKAFTGGTVEKLRPRVQQITHELLDKITPLGEADLVEDYAVPLPVTVISELLGVPEGDRMELRSWSHGIFVGGATSRDTATHRVEDYMTTLVAAKRSHPGDDLISELIAARDERQQLSEAELISLAVITLIAGHETTANLIGSAVLALLQNPAQMAKLRDDPELLPPAIEEFLRYEAPTAIATIRFTATPVQYGNVTIPQDNLVMVSLGAACRDPDRFPDPADLEIERSAQGHLAFGHGIHHCLGAALARTEAEIAIGSLLARLDNLRITSRDFVPKWRHSRLMRGLESLPVRWDPPS